MFRPSIRRCFFRFILILLACSSARATTWDIDGYLETCDPTACNLAGIEVGTPFVGFLNADSAASGPNSAFDETSIQNYLLAGEGVSVGPADSTLDSAMLSTDGNGELATGSMQFSGTVDTGTIFGDADLDIVVDITLMRFTISTTFLGLGEVASGPITSMLEADGDELAAIEDNCIEIANVDQTDTDGDGYGNACDPDFNGNGIVDPADFSLLKARFGQTGFPDQDMNGNGIIDPFDFSRLKSMFGQPPGPSGVIPPAPPPPAAATASPGTQSVPTGSASKGQSTTAVESGTALR